MFRLRQCKNFPISLQKCPSSPCVHVLLIPLIQGESYCRPQQTIGFLDPSAQASAPGWPLRNLLAYLRAVHPEATQTVRVLCWRGDAQSSRFGVLRGGPTSSEKPSSVGWEKNVQGKVGARVADLAPMMDPKRSVSSPSARSTCVMINLDRQTLGPGGGPESQIDALEDSPCSRPGEDCTDAMPATWCGHPRVLRCAYAHGQSAGLTDATVFFLF